MWTGPQTDVTLLQTHHLAVNRTILLASGSDEFINVSQGPPDATYAASIVYSQTQELPSVVGVTSITAAFLSQSGHVSLAIVSFCATFYLVSHLFIVPLYILLLLFIVPLCEGCATFLRNQFV